ncbi:hypothetical protein [Devosia rhizoryzae]|uniref:FAD dependent oxidoreductase domain-containing protein n=1 Tax=Devosia rhizoryzae TaxID=2774137 RepID=A0ABX7C3W2_9HYPH|nr:hypothetical protein [Devosia rhizoryzae]QQR37934.1 hypothetical protein JI748_08950 [Devosia rhizoryzae]
MSDTQADFAVFGSTPLARLLAGLLASVHGRKVIFVGESQSGYRLPRSIELSVAPVTRPETWALLAEGVAETMRLIGKVAGRAASSRVDPIFFAESAWGIEALSHIRHMAMGFRIAAEPVAPSLLGAGRSGIILRDAIRLNRPVLEPALDLWLDRHKVQRLAPDRVEIALDGSVSIHAGGKSSAAQQAVLVDPEAIMAWLPLRQWPTLFRRQPAATILTTPTQPIAAPVMLEVGDGTVLLQQAEGGIAGIGRGDLAAFSASMRSLLGAERQVEQAGQTAFPALVTADGAPAVGRAGGTGADVVANLGMTGVFLAPALARWLAGDAQQHQANWFAARLVTRNVRSASVSEFAPPLEDRVA